jgi:mxaL protein
MTPVALNDPRFWILSVAASLLALTFFLSRVERDQQIYDVFAVVDITGSMLVRDMDVGGRPVTRLDAAKDALTQLASDLPCQSRLGLGVFTERRSFVLFNPVEVCGDFAPLEVAIQQLDWRMAWEGDSMVTKGLHHAIALAQSMKANVIFLTEGQEAPPLPPGLGAPAFEGKPGEVGGVVAGVGLRTKSPLPKFDDEGREKGTYSAEDVPQENRTGPPPPDAESRPGYHPKWAPFGSGPPEGDEHLSSVRHEHLAAIAGQAGLGYVELATSPRLIDAVRAHAQARSLRALTDLRPYAGLAALALLALLYSWPLARSFARRRKTETVPHHSLGVVR